VRHQTFLLILDEWLAGISIQDLARDYDLDPDEIEQLIRERCKLVKVQNNGNTQNK
jgi:uncharacterized protein (DUF433 family)